jgi:hypothetical protein
MNEPPPQIRELIRRIPTLKPVGYTCYLPISAKKKTFSNIATNRKSFIYRTPQHFGAHGKTMTWRQQWYGIFLPRQSCKCRNRLKNVSYLKIVVKTKFFFRCNPSKKAACGKFRVLKNKSVSSNWLAHQNKPDLGKKVLHTSVFANLTH